MYADGQRNPYGLTGVTMAEEERADRMAIGFDVMLAPREQAVAALRLQGVPVQEVAQELGIKPSSVRTTMHRVYQKCGVTNLDELGAALTEPTQDASCVSKNVVEERGTSLGATVQLVAEACFLLCAPIALIYCFFMHISPVRFYLNDALAAGLMALGAILALLYGPALKRCMTAKSPWARGVLAFTLAACSIAGVGEVLFTWMLMGRVVPAEGAAHLMAYMLCFVVSLLPIGVAGTTRLDACEVLRVHPIVLGSALVAQVAIAAWASREVAIAIVVLVTAISASACLFCCAGPIPGLDFSPCKKMFNMGEGAVPKPAWAFCVASIVFGMGLGAASMSSVYGLVEVAACLPSVAVIACVGYAWHRVGALPALQLVLRAGLMLGGVGIIAIVTHSYLVGFLAGSVVACIQVSCALRGHVKRVVRARSWGRACALLVWMGALLGVLFLAVLLRMRIAPFDLHATIAWEFFGAGMALFIAFGGSCAIWRLCQSFLDAVALGSCEGALYPGDIQRMRAFLVLHGMGDFECEVVLRTIEGASIREIACGLHYSASSVKAARAEAYRMLSVHDVRGLREALSQVIAM